jgi:hypothetical protein
MGMFDSLYIDLDGTEREVQTNMSFTGWQALQDVSSNW